MGDRAVAATVLKAAVAVAVGYVVFMRIVRPPIQRMNEEAYITAPFGDFKPPTFAGPVPRKVTIFSTEPEDTAPVRINRASNPGWTFSIYDVNSAGDYMKTNCPLYLPAYKALKPIAFKADLFRYCALWNEAGVYLDDDIVLMDTFDALLTPAGKSSSDMPGDIILCGDRPHTGFYGQVLHRQIINGFMVAAVKRAPIFRCAMETILEHVKDRRVSWPRSVNKNLQVTGPSLLSECLTNDMNPNFVWYNELNGRIVTYDGTDSPKVALMHLSIKRKAMKYSKMTDFSKPDTIYGDPDS